MCVTLDTINKKRRKGNAHFFLLNLSLLSGFVKASGSCLLKLCKKAVFYSFYVLPFLFEKIIRLAVRKDAFLQLFYSAYGVSLNIRV